MTGPLFEEARDYLLSVARRQLPRDLRSKVDASDLVQDTFLKAHCGCHRFTGETVEHLRAWLRRILLNHLCSVTRHYRGTGKRQVLREVPLAVDCEQAAARRSADPAAGLSTQELSEALRSALQRLPEEHRQVLRWRQEDRLPFAEIGRRLGVSPEAARKVWGRALAKLRALLRRHAQAPLAGRASAGILTCG